MAAEIQISQPPSLIQTVTNRAFQVLCQAFAWLTVAIAVFIVLKIAVNALPAIHQYGFGFLTGTVWNPKTKVYSILPEIWGTLYSSAFALLLATAFGLAAAVFLAEGLWAIPYSHYSKWSSCNSTRCGANCPRKRITCSVI